MIEKLAADFPTVPTYQSNQGGTLHNLAELLRDQGELDQAREFLKQAIAYQQAALKINPQNQSFRLFLRNHYSNLADILLRQGEHAEAARVAAELARVRPENASDSYKAACLLALAVSKAQTDTRLAGTERHATAELYADRAIELLRRAVAAGFKDFDHMEMDKDLDSIRAGSRYKELIEKKEQ